MVDAEVKFIIPKKNQKSGIINLLYSRFYPKYGGQRRAKQLLVEEEDTFSSFLTIKEENVISTGEISHLFLFTNSINFKSFTSKRNQKQFFLQLFTPILQRRRRKPYQGKYLTKMILRKKYQTPVPSPLWSRSFTMQIRIWLWKGKLLNRYLDSHVQIYYDTTPVIKETIFGGWGLNKSYSTNIFSDF